MVGEHDDLGGLIGVVQSDIAVRVWVLVGADGASEELHASNLFPRIDRRIGQRPAFALGGESRPHKFRANQSVRKRSSVTHCDLDSLHRLKDSRVVFPTMVERPNILADAGVQRIPRDLPATEGSARIWLFGQA